MLKSTKQTLLFLSIFTLVVSCSKDKSDETIKTITSKLNSIIENEFSKNEPGGSFLIKKGKNIVFEKSIGLADIETKEKITQNTIFNTGSISKTFVANGVLILHERGLLSLDDNLNKYFDDFKNKEIAKKVKIKHLLSHTSGLPDLRDIRNNIEFYITAKDTANFEPLKQADSLNFQPGEKFQYSNPAYNGLALIIEKITKKPWQDFIKEEIFKPAGMTNSKITNGAYPDKGVSHAYYKGKNGQYTELDYGETPTFAAAGNGGIWSTVLDLAKYEQAIQENIFLGKELVQKSRTLFHPENWKSATPPRIGYSWFIGEQSLFRESNLKVHLIQHTGSQGGFNAFYITIPEKEIIFIGLFNKPVEVFRGLILQTLTLLETNNWLD